MFFYKALAAVCIFALLFALAWVADRKYNDDKPSRFLDLQENPNGMQHFFIYEPFKPREYVRIRRNSPVNDQKRDRPLP